MSPTSMDVLGIRKKLGRGVWRVPAPFGPDGWSLTAQDERASVIITCAEHDGREWLHASIARDEEMPTYQDLVLLHRAVWGDGFAYQVFVPSSRHVNIHEHALHLWGLRDGTPVLPEFGLDGSI